MEKNPHAIGSYILPLKWSLGIGYGICRKYLPIWVSVADRNWNSGFGRTLYVGYSNLDLPFSPNKQTACDIFFC